MHTLILLTLNSYFAYQPSNKQSFIVVVGYRVNLHTITAFGGIYCGRFGSRNLKTNMVAANVNDKNETSNSCFSLNSMK